MRFTKTPLATVTVRYGLIAGALAAIVMVVIYYMGQHPLIISALYDYRNVLFGLFVFFGLKEFRDQQNNGVLYFWQGMIGSYIIVFLASVITSLGVIVFASVESHFVTSYIAQRAEIWKSYTDEEVKIIGEEVLASNFKDLYATNGIELAKMYFGQGVIIGLFISIIISVILRKQPKTL